MKQFEAAEGFYREAWELMLAIPDLDESVACLSTQLAIGQAFGKALMRIGNNEEAAVIFSQTEKPVDHLLDRIDEEIANGKQHREFRSAYNNVVSFVNVVAVAKRLEKDDGFDRMVRCEEIFKNIDPDLLTPSNRKLRAGTRMNLSIMYRDRDPGKSLEFRKLAVDEFRELAKFNANVPNFKYNFVKAARNLGSALVNQGKLEAGKVLIDEASDAADELLEIDPDSDRFLNARLLVYDSRAIYHGAREEFDDAANFFVKKLDLAQRRLALLPDEASRIYGVGFIHFQLAQCDNINENPWSAFFNLLQASSYSKKLSGGAKRHLDSLIKKQLGKTTDSIMARIL